MWNRNYKKVKGIVTKTGYNEFKIDFDKLSEMTNHYQKFIEKVKANFEEREGDFDNVVVYIDEQVDEWGPRKGEKVTKIYVAFDHGNIYIRLLGCDVNHEKYPHIFEFSQNKIFVSMMAELL